MNVPVVYADESCLTTKLLPKQEWMIKGKNVEIDEKKLNAKTVAFVVALSEDMGLVELSTYPKSLDQWDFINFWKKFERATVIGELGYIWTMLASILQSP